MAITFDDALIRYVGQFGPGQWRVIFLVSLIQVPNALAFMLLVFLCVDPVTNKAWECLDIEDTACSDVWRSPSPREGFCGLEAHTWRWTSTDSLIAQFNLVCADAWQVQVANSIMFVGCFIGSGLFGTMCDKIGRRKPLFISTMVVAAATFGSLASSSYWGIIAARAVSGIGAAGQTSCMFLLCTECTGPIYRGRASVASLVGFTIGEFLLVALAYALPNWRHLTIAAGAINAGALLLYPCIHESARWLLSQGRHEEAKHLLRSIAAGNRSQMPSEPLTCSHGQHVLGVSDAALADDSDADSISPVDSEAGISSSAHAGAGNDGAAAQKMGLLELLRTRSLLVRSAVLVCTWFSLMLVYYGISLGAGGLPGSVYVTFALGTAAEVVALLFAGPAVDTIGRHSVVSGGLLLGGSACLACANVSGQVAQAVLAAFGKFGCSAAESVIAIFTAELYPTNVRSTAMGVFNQASRLGSIAAPFLLMLGAQLSVGPAPAFLPYLVFGALSLLTGLLVLVLPETLGASMPESLQDLQQLQSIFSAKPWRQGCRGILAFVFRASAASAPQSGHTKPPATSTAVPAINVSAFCGDMDTCVAGRMDSSTNKGAANMGNKGLHGPASGANSGSPRKVQQSPRAGTGGRTSDRVPGDQAGSRVEAGASQGEATATATATATEAAASDTSEVVVTVIAP